jgi:hypothetical protein
MSTSEDPDSIGRFEYCSDENVEFRIDEADPRDGD